MGKVEDLLCSASEAVPQKVAVSASRNVSLVDGCFSLRFVQFYVLY